MPHLSIMNVCILLMMPHVGPMIRQYNIYSIRSNSYTSFLFFTPEKEIAPLVKWSLRLPYTFLSVGSPFIEEGGKMP
jgi:hypothetical protein